MYFRVRGIDFYFFLRFFQWILELFRQCGVFAFHVIDGKFYDLALIKTRRNSPI